MLTLHAVNGYYDRSHVLHDIDLCIPQGQITAVLGRNGMGKTSLLKAIMGTGVRASGSIRLDGQEIQPLPAHRRARSGIAYVPQGRGIIPDFTVRENILMGGFARTPRSSEMPPRVLSLFPYLARNLARSGGVLSGGQQQQLAIARALAAQPKVMLLDEPNEGIQPSVVEQIERAILALNQELGITIVLVEQNIAFARRAATHFAMLEKGRIAAQGGIAGLTDDIVDRYMTV